MIIKVYYEDMDEDMRNKRKLILIFNDTLQQWSCIVFEIKMLQWIWKKYKNIIYLNKCMDENWIKMFNYKFSFEEIFWRFYQNNRILLDQRLIGFFFLFIRSIL